MIENAMIGLIFLIAIAYVVRLIFKSFQTKSGCGSGCSKCAIDFSKIEHQLEKDRT